MTMMDWLDYLDFQNQGHPVILFIMVKICLIAMMDFYRIYSAKKITPMIWSQGRNCFEEITKGESHHKHRRLRLR